jgi:hypothetical protein
MDEFIERKICVGLIVSDSYIQEVKKIWNNKYLTSSAARIISQWCLEYYDKYQKSPQNDIEGIYVQKLKEQKIGKEQGEDIEDILDSLSAEYDGHQFNTQYLLDSTKTYFQERRLQLFQEEITACLQSGDLPGAETAASSYAPPEQEEQSCIDPFESEERIKEVFSERIKPLIKFPGALGDFWNDQFVRDGLVGLMAPEKRGKSWLLMEIAMQGIKQGCNVVFFQAGDMSEAQMIRRMCIYLARKSDQEKYCQELYIPTLDCIYNQNDTCEKGERESPFGVIDMDVKEFAKITKDELLEAFKNNPEYAACHNCKNIRGTAWLKKKAKTSPLSWKEAYKKVRAFRTRHHNKLRLSTYPNETLSIQEINSLLSLWEKQDNFIPDIILIDYADILASDMDSSRLEPRNQQNKIWQRLRKLSQQKHCLVVTATQADAASYDKKTLGLSNFSEDKRKYGHVTAFFGLNQTEDEKRIGIMRINELVVRDGAFDRAKQVRVLQCLEIGRPFLDSYK